MKVGGDDQPGPVGGEGYLAGRAGELRRLRRVQAEVTVPGRDPRQGVADAQEALHRAAVAGVEHVQQASAHGDAHREGPARGDDLAAGKPVAGHREDGDGVAACVDRVQQAAAAVVGQPALRGKVVGDRSAQRAAQAASRVSASDEAGPQLLDRPPQRESQVAPFRFPGGVQAEPVWQLVSVAGVHWHVGWRQKCLPILADTSRMTNRYAQVVKRLSPRNCVILAMMATTASAVAWWARSSSSGTPGPVLASCQPDSPLATPVS